MGVLRCWVFAAWLVAVAVHQACAVTFELGSTRRRCIFEQLRKDQLATGEYVVLGGDASDVSVDVSVKGPAGDEIFTKVRSSGGKFGFTAARAGDYTVCFQNNDLIEHRIKVSLRSGVEAKDLSEIVQRDHLKPLSAEILRIDETIKNVRSELLLLKQREAEMRETNESINSRVTWFSLFSVGVVTTLGVWQILTLKSYFMEKKLI
mmetsp:Transcript_19821/g.35246  ORF Transcript_19821/g.35246 Transcript_19821/m.35246 type:complete len:206 (-) Transcript_19821:236-853(-)|eukprot:CAMPEP_0184524204 /NCGR_PEP_ID=MMETSP0198_2-20121128/9367_1 /TAXON_ID=1112570 /ORGANISM="Thraustochytrium sp., Strain LLF1b" /LENGTH=205 /DNA_ID=CAMNT_0026915435 /DNA_START=77 /DNA_END=694 /DNA_ORIENTATION=-